MAPGSPDLRHRRRESEDDAREEEIKPLLEESVKKDISSSDESDTSLGYKLDPLVERSIILRLDVGPFLLIYSILIPLDVMQDQISLFDYIFPLVLFGQLALFIMQQWKVRMRSRVGFKTSPNIQSMTHCLVEVLHGDKHESAHDYGIVASSKTDEGVVVVRFRDIIFRSPITTTKEDVDVALWTSEKDSSEAAASKTTSSFHRLRYPINLPLEFYAGWAGFRDISTLVVAQRVYGPNTTPIELPPFLTLLQEQVVAPFFLFQVLCVILWSLDECKFLLDRLPAKTVLCNVIPQMSSLQTGITPFLPS
jgi:hypothetical protein